MPQGPEGRPKPAPRKEGDEPPTLSRRGLLAALGLGGLTAAGVVRVATSRIEGGAGAEASDEAAVPRERHVVPEARVERNETYPEGPYPTGVLAGRSMANLFADYVGLPDPSTMPEELPDRYRAALADLWGKKRRFVQRREPGWIDNTLQAEEIVLERYRAWRESGNRQQETLAGLNATLRPVIEAIHDSMDFTRLDEIREFSNLTDADKRLVKTLAGNISSEMLLSYGMTELMPSVTDAKMNVDMTEFLVSTAGEPYMACLPAVHDAYVSFGWFQFTSHAVFGGPGTKKGASLINQFVRDDRYQIPGSVIHLASTEQQMRAAYLFAVYNLAHLVAKIRREGGARLRAERIETLTSHATSLNAGTLQYIATAHHNPAQARRGFISWLDDGLQGKHSEHCGSRIRDYAKKTKRIYDEFRSRLGS